MANGSIVTLGGTAPAGLTAGTQYFVVNASGNTYQLAATLGGLPIDFTSAGTSVTQTVIGTNGTLNKISVGGLATGFVDKGVFFGDANYAYNAATNFLRAPVYGTDAGFVTSAATTSVASATHQNISGSLSAQNTATFTTFKIAGGFNVALATDQVMTVDGILKTGGNAGTISGTGTLAGIRASSGSEMVIRSNASGDTLTISTPILNNNTSALTKSGAGTLTLTAANTYTGVTTVAAGTLTVSGTGSLEDNSPVTVTGGTYNVSVNDTVGVVTLKNGVIGGTTTLTGSGYEVENGTISARLAGTGSLVKSTSGQVILAGVNTYDGGTTITGGTLAVTGAGRLNDFGTIVISGGGIYDVGGPDVVGDVTLVNGTIRGSGALNASTYDVQSGIVSVPLAGTGTLTKSTAGTVTLAGVNTLVGEILVDAGSLVLADNARLNFAVSDIATANTVNGTGTAVFDGDFTIDLVTGSPDLTPGNEWLLVNPTLTESYGASFSVVGFTVKPDGVTWTRTLGANQWTFSETSGKLSVGPAGYAAWATANNVTQGENGDDDSDGVINLVEYALGLDPQVSTVPAGSFVGNLLTFVKGPEAKVAGDVTYIIETSTTLGTGSWAPAPATETTNDISFALPPNQPGGKLFARLRVTKL
jgi:autotransporter-associated beta strand protein